MVFCAYPVPAPVAAAVTTFAPSGVGTVALKRDLLREDPKEHREAVVLQYGHTFGHPLEHLSGYRLYHGESVAIGMMVAARVARLLGACSDALGVGFAGAGLSVGQEHDDTQ